MHHNNGVFRYRNIINRSREPVIALPVCLVEIGPFVLVPMSQQPWASGTTRDRQLIDEFLSPKLLFGTD